MNKKILILIMAASAAAASAQTTAKPAAPAATAAKPAATTATAKSTTAKSAAAVASPNIAPIIKAPTSIPPVKGLQKAIITVALRYQDEKIGTGALAEPGKQLKILYTGYRAADGVKFDSTEDHPRQPLKDKDGKP